VIYYEAYKPIDDARNRERNLKCGGQILSQVNIELLKVFRS
jgi:hypothetical protein